MATSETHSLASQVGQVLRERDATLATAESCTGGLIGASLTAVAGISDTYLGGIVAYANSVKVRALGVDPATIDTFGAVSEETAMAMAGGARRCLQADFAVSVTGVAGPGGGTDDKPVGLVYLAVATPTGTYARRHVFDGDRSQVRAAAVRAALRLILDAVDGPPA